MIKHYRAYNENIQEFSLSILENKLELAGRNTGLDKQALEMVVREAAFTLYENMPERELDKALMQSASQHIKDDPNYDRSEEHTS